MMHEIIAAIPIILSLVILESLLSVDNALVLAAMVSHLPEAQQKWALRAGMIGAYGLRGVSLLFVAYIIANPWVKLIAGAYLIYLMCSHLGVEEGEEEAKKVKAGFWGTVVAVELADLTFSIDNVAAAAAFSNKMWVIFTGVFIGIAAMRFISGAFVKLIEKFPVLNTVAYLLVGWVGVGLWAEYLLHVEVNEIIKFGGVLGIIALGLIHEQVPGAAIVMSPIVKPGQKFFQGIAKVIDYINPARLVRGEPDHA